MAWWLAWFPDAVAHLRDPLLTDHIDAPGGVNLMWNTSMPLAAAVLSPVTTTAGPLVAYALLVTAAPVLNASAAFVALRRLVPGVAGPAAGGLLFGFSPFVLAQSLAHAQLTLLATAPLELLALHSLLVRRAPPLRTGAVLGLLASAQLLLSEEVLAIEVVAAAVSLAVAAVVWRGAVRERLRAAALACAVAVAVFAALCAVPLGVQLLGPQHPHGNPESPDVFVTDAANLVLPTGVQAVAPQRSLDEYADRIGRNTAEEGGYAGVPLLAVGATAAWVWRRRRQVLWASLSALAVTVLALGAHLRVDGRAVDGVPLPWRPLQALPVLSAVLPARFMAVAFLFLAVVVAAAVAELPALTGVRRHAWGVALAAVAVTLAPALPYAATRWDVPPYFTGSGVDAVPGGSLALLAPFPDGTTPQTMLWQASSGMRFRMLGGYAYRPDAAGAFTLRPPPSTTASVLQDIEAGGPVERPRAQLEGMLAELRSWGVGSVLVGPDAHGAAFVALFTRLLGRSADAVGGGVSAWYAVGARLPDAGTPST